MESVKESLRFDEGVVHVDHEDSQHAQSHRINIEGHGEVRLWDLNEHGCTLNGFPREWLIDFDLLLLRHLLLVLTIQNRHVHDIETSLRVVRILLKVHHTFLDAKCDDKLRLWWNNQVSNRNHVLAALRVLAANVRV